MPSSSVSVSPATSSSSVWRGWSRPVCSAGSRYSEHPPRYDYRLTDKGRDLWPVLTAMRQWGDRYSAPLGPPLVVTHKECGSSADAVLVCGSCGERVGPRDVKASAGPGLRQGQLLPDRAPSP